MDAAGGIQRLCRGNALVLQNTGSGCLGRVPEAPGNVTLTETGWRTTGLRAWGEGTPHTGLCLSILG
jgi:hypothetical protein